jgi:uncharacterized membrane protein
VMCVVWDVVGFMGGVACDSRLVVCCLVGLLLHSVAARLRSRSFVSVLQSRLTVGDVKHLLRL